MSTGDSGNSDPETKLKLDGTPDHRFKEVSTSTSFPSLHGELIIRHQSTEAAPTGTRADARPGSRRSATVPPGW